MALTTSEDIANTIGKLLIAFHSSKLMLNYIGKDVFSTEILTLIVMFVIFAKYYYKSNPIQTCTTPTQCFMLIWVLNQDQWGHLKFKPKTLASST